jgi:hypothetical protein
VLQDVQLLSFLAALLCLCKELKEKEIKYIRSGGNLHVRQVDWNKKKNMMHKDKKRAEIRP